MCGKAEEQRVTAQPLRHPMQGGFAPLHSAAALGSVGFQARFNKQAVGSRGRRSPGERWWGEQKPTCQGYGGVGGLRKREGYRGGMFLSDPFEGLFGTNKR